ncbi:hypothetical protein C6W19_24720 [Bacillus sp. RJGP41]|nr:hypothetical protein C6W19_24720 [Bacillus sp. RJGP41]
MPNFEAFSKWTSNNLNVFLVLGFVLFFVIFIIPKQLELTAEKNSPPKLVSGGEFENIFETIWNFGIEI